MNQQPALLLVWLKPQLIKVDSEPVWGEMTHIRSLLLPMLLKKLQPWTHRELSSQTKSKLVSNSAPSCCKHQGFTGLKKSLTVKLQQQNGGAAVITSTVQREGSGLEFGYSLCGFFPQSQNKHFAYICEIGWNFSWWPVQDLLHLSPHSSWDRLQASCDPEKRIYRSTFNSSIIGSL